VKELKIVLIGQPNVGKSCLLNALVGPIVEISNYPGTTVEVTKAKKIFDNTEIIFEDTPGIYSISDRSKEEKITERSLFEEKVDKAIIIADSTSLERSLYVALQILEAQIPIVIALNFVEEAEKKGIRIDYEKLEKILRVPVVPINPLTKKGINELVDVLLKNEKITEEIFTVGYDDDIEEAIDKISPHIKEIQLPKRFIALRILEGDIDFYKYLKDKKIIKEVKKGLYKHPEVSEDISITRYGTAAFIAEKVTQITPLKKEGNLQDKIDNILLHKILGPVLTILFFFVIFGILLFVGSLIQKTLLGLTETLLSRIQGSGIIIVILNQALYGVMAGISIALPYVFLFYLLFGLIEDVGLLSRFVTNLDRFLKKLKLPGKSCIPLALGLGCTVPAIRAARVLSSEKEQFHTASYFAFVPCSSRTAIIIGIVGYYGGIALALSVFATLLIASLIWAFGIRIVGHVKCEPLLLELPPYRKPLINNIIAKSWIRMKGFVYVVIPLLAIGGIVYAILDMTGVTNTVIAPLSPITCWLGLPPVTIIPLVFGFLQKDLTGAMLLTALGSNISLALSPLQIYTFGVATTIQIPCIIALGMLIKEFGFKKAILLTGVSMVYGLLFAGLIWRIISIF
jgi:ferrous iron transport protein B